MASDTITGSTSNQYIDSKIEWSSTPDTETNSSSVTAKLYYKRNNAGYTTEGYQGSFSITINGTTKSVSGVHLEITEKAWVLAMTATVTVAHDDDGAKTITISATGKLPPSSLESTNCSGTATLDTIARASVPTVSASSVVMLGSVTVYTNRKSTSFTHDLTYSFGSSTGTIATGVGASYSWTVPDLVSKIPGKSSGTCTITCKTKSGSTVIGTKTVTVTITVPTSVPTVSASSVAMFGSVTINTNRKSSSLTHDLTYSFGGSTGTISTGVGASYEWIVPDLVSKIPGESGGTCTITCTTKNGSTVIGTKTVTVTITTPDSVPTVSASSVAMFGSVTINTNRKSTSLTHDLTYSFGGSTGTIATGVGASYSWTVPDMASKIPGKSSGTCTITCKAKSGSTVIDTKTVTITITIPEKSTPSASASTVKMGTSVTIYTNRKSSAYTHTLSYSIGSASGTIDTGVGASKTWTPPKSLAAHTGDKTSAICTITCQTYNGSLLVGTATTQINLTVPEGGTVLSISASTVEMGSKITISMAEESEVYTHSLTYALKKHGGSTVIATGNIGNHNGGNYEWTVPLSLAAKVPSDTEATIDVICKTWIGTNLVGTETASFTATVPNNSTTQPKFTISVNGVDTFNEEILAGRSKVKVSISASSDYSTIKSYLTELPNAKGSTNPYTSPVISKSGEVWITCTVTDARGYSTQKSVYVPVTDYSRPRIIPGSGQNKIICTRCNSNGEADPGGVYLLIKVGRSYSKIVYGDIQKNYCKLSYRWKTDADNSYSAPVELLSRTSSTDYVNTKLSGIVTSNTTSYNIQLIAEDDVGETDTATITVPTAFASFHVPRGGHGFTLGGYHDPEKHDVFDCWFDAEFHGNVSGIYSHGKTDGWYWRKYGDGIAECWRRVNNEARDINTPLGSMYYANCDEVTFPFDFCSAPVVTATVEGGTALSILSWQGADGNGTTTASRPASYCVISPTPTTGAAFTIAYHAIGKWKE